jgi:broad specificity phosphatase PhoE
MELMLIRHGDPDYPNHTLTEKGHRQAQLLAESLRPVPIDRLIVSPLGRARHTADYLIRLKGLDFDIVEFFQELDGRYTDTDWAWAYHGCDLLAPGLDITKSNWQTRVPYGKHMGPVYQKFTSQFDAFISDFGLERSGHVYKVNEHIDETIAVVCHAGVITTLLSHLLHIPLPVVYAQFWIDPSSVTRLKLEIKDGLGVFRLISLNDMSHTLPLAEESEYRLPQS